MSGLLRVLASFDSPFRFSVPMSSLLLSYRSAISVLHDLIHGSLHFGRKEIRRQKGTRIKGISTTCKKLKLSDRLT